MCCSSSGGSKGAAKILVRTSFGLTLMLMGAAYFLKIQTPTGFLMLMNEGLLGTPFEMLGTVMAYLLPSLMILGGFLFTIGAFLTVGTWAAGLALALFPVVIMLKAVISPAIDPTTVMPFVVYGVAWLILFKMVAKGGCGPKSCSGGNCAGMCGSANGNCDAAVCSACGKSPCVCGKPSSAPVAAKTWSPAKTAAKPAATPAPKKATAPAPKKSAPKSQSGTAM